MLLSVDQSKRMNASEALKHPWIVVRKNTALKFVFDNILMNGTIVKKETIFNAREDIYTSVNMVLHCVHTK